MKNILYIICLVILYPLADHAQTDPLVCNFWRPVSLSGHLRLGGHYRYEEGTTNDIYNYTKNPQVYGGMLINSSSYFWHPNFMTLDLGAEYNPIKNQDDYLVVPDQSEVRTIKRLDVNSVFFKQKPVTVGIFANFNECYTNRENLSNLKLNSINYGGNLFYSNKILPVRISYQHGKWNEYEIQTGRNFITHQSFLTANINKSFSTRDKNEFRYYHNNFFRQDDTLSPTNNISDNFDLINAIDLDNLRLYTFRSHITGINQKGDDTFSRIQANESISLKLPANFTLTGNYDLYHIQRKLQESTQNNLYGSLGYQLFQSLNAKVYFEDNTIRNTFYEEHNNKLGFEVRYDKKIPKGQISLSYITNHHRQKRVSDVVIIQVFNEAHNLSDGQIVLLDKSYIYESSIMVKDATGTIIYQLNFDYILINRNNFTEIQRVPGGQIANNSAIYVDYSYLPPGSYQFDASYRQFSASLIAFGKILELYFRLAKQDYDNLESTELVTLNYFTQQVYGCRLEYSFASGGIEYESYNSTIIPYRLMRYFFLLQGTYHDKLLYSLNGNMRDYQMLDDKTNQKYLDLACNVAYMFTAQTKLNFEFGYRKQLGQGINLDLLTSKAELTTVFRQVFFKLGIQVYQRIYLGEQTNFIGGYFEIVRTFNWNRR